MDIIDVNDFTNQLQKSVKDNLTPELTKVNDLTKEFQNSVIEGNWSVAIDLVGSDKVKEINTELTSSSAYFEKIKSEATLISEQLNKAVGSNELNNIISDKQLELTQRIANAGDLIKESNEQTIPSLQTQIQQEQTKLSLLNLNDSNYISQLETVKQLEETLVRENTRTADLIGQQQGLIDLKDTELQKFKDIVDNGGVMSDIYTKLGRYSNELIKSSEQNLKVNMDLRDVMSEMGNNQKELIEGAKDVIDEYTDGLDKIGKGITDAFASLPLVGGMLSAMVKVPLEEATEIAQKKLRSALVNSGDATQALTDGMSAFGSGIANIGKSIAGLLLNPIFLIVAAFGAFLMLLKSAYDEMGKIEEAGREFRFSIGASAQSTLRIRDIIEQTRDEFTRFGIGIEEATKSAIALGDVFASNDFIQKETVQTVAMLDEAFGIAAETSAQAIDNLMKMGASSAQDATKNIMHMQKLSQRYGVSFAKVMDDVAGASEEALIFAGGSAKNLAKAAVEARKMGTSIEDMASAADRLLDFESSINSQMQASTMLGRNLNLNRLRALAMEGDAEGMAKEQLAILKQQGGLRNLNRFQQKAIADAMGTELSTLLKLESTERQRNETRKLLEQLAEDGDKNAQKRLAEMNKKVEESKLSAKEQLKIKLEENRVEEANKAIQDEINQAMLDLKTTLLPIVQDLMPTFLNIAQLLPPIFGAISTALDFITAPFQLIVGLLNAIQDGGKSFTSMFTADLGGITKLIVGVVGAFMIGMTLLKGIPNIFTSIIDKIKGGFGGIMDMVKSLGDGIGGAVKKLADGFGSALGSLGTGVSNIVKSIGDGIAGLAKGIGKGIASIFDGIGKGIKSLVSSLGSLNPANMAKAAVGLLVLAGALFVSAKAFQEFSKVNWDDIGKGLVGILGLTGIAVLLSKASASMIQGAAAVALLGVALIPAAYAFQMFSEVSWKDVIFGGIAIGALAAAAFGLGLILGPIALGATAIALLGASIIPLAFALDLAAPALESFGKIFLGFASIMLKGVQTIIGGLIDFAEIVGGVIVNVVKSISGIITSISDGIVGVIGAVSGAISATVSEITRLAEIDAVNLIAVAGGIAAVGVALASFGVGGGIGAVTAGAGNAVGALGNSIAGLFGADTEELNKSPLQKILDFAKESDSIILVSDKVDFLLNSFDRLAGMESILETAASALQTFGDALSSFGAGNATAGISNTVGAMGNAFAGLFGAETPQDPIDQLIGFVNKLGSVDLNIESLELLSKLNLGGFLSNVTDDFSDKITMVSEGMDDLFIVFNKLQPTAISSIDRVSGGLTKLLSGLSASLPKIKISDSRNLTKVADALDDFFDAIDDLNTSKVKVLPEIGVSMIPFVKDFSELPLSSISEDVSSIMNDLGDGIYHFFDELARTDLTILPNLVEINAGIIPFITEFATIPLSSISEDVSSIMNDLGDGIYHFFNELAPTDLTILPHLVNIQQGVIPFVNAFGQASLPSESFDSILKDLGNGIEEFADFVNDGEAGKINKFFKDAGTSFPKFVESMAALGSVGDVSIVGKLSILSDISNTLNIENVNKLKTFTSEVVDAINSFSGIQDPAVEALSAISSELYMLCEVIDKLDTDKLNGLQNINLGGVQTPIKIPARKTEQEIIEGTIGPKFMMTEMADLPVVDVAGGSLPPSDPFATPGPSLAEVFSTPIAETQVQQIADTGTTSLAEVFSSPPPETQVQQVAETGTTSLAEAFASPPPETVTTILPPESKATATDKIINEVAQPFVSMFGNIYNAVAPDFVKDKIANLVGEKYFGLVDGLSIEEIQNINTTGINKSKATEDLLIMSASDKYEMQEGADKSTSSFKSTVESVEFGKAGSFLDQIMAGLIQGNAVTKTFTEGTEVALQSNMTTQSQTIDDKTTIDSDFTYGLTDVSEKLQKSVDERLTTLDDAIIKGATFESDLMNEAMADRKQQLIDEGRLVTSVVQSQVEPMSAQIQESISVPPIKTEQTSQVEPMNTQLQETTTAPTNILTKIADFTSNLVPDLGLLNTISDQDQPTPTSNIELSGLENISVKGHSVFVEEIAKIVNTGTPTTDSEKTEDSTKVVKKLDELILLMRRGGISVNMDGRKVSRAVASAHDQ